MWFSPRTVNSLTAKLGDLKRKKIPSQAKQCTQNNGGFAKKLYLWYGSYLSDLGLNQDNDVDARPSKFCPH